MQLYAAGFWVPAGMEALNGLLLIGWSASYTYLSMERLWLGARAPVAAQAAPPA